MAITPWIPSSTLTSLPSGIWSGAGGYPVLPFLDGQSPSVKKGSLWSTERITTASGRVRKTAYWPYPKWTFELSYNVMRHGGTIEELNTMWEFFNALQGQFATFLFVDPNDCQVLQASPAAVINPSTGLSTGDGSTKTFTITRPLNSVVEPLFSVFSPTFLDNGSAAGAHTVSGGNVTFTTAPTSGHALTWYGYYYFGCEFTDDALTFEQIVPLLLFKGDSLKFQSLRV